MISFCCKTIFNVGEKSHRLENIDGAREQASERAISLSLGGCQTNEAVQFSPLGVYNRIHMSLLVFI